MKQRCEHRWMVYHPNSDPLRKLSRLKGSTNRYWHDTWYTSGKYGYITLYQLLSKLAISYTTMLSLLSNCLSKLPIQVPYKFRVEISCVDYNHWVYLWCSGNKKSMPLKVLFTTLWQVLSASAFV